MVSNAVVELKKARVNVRKYGQLIQKPDGSLQKNPAITILRDYESILTDVVGSFVYLHNQEWLYLR